MSKADMMFKAMGYEKTLDDDHNIFFEKYFAPMQCTETIAFVREYKMVEISYDKDIVVTSLDVEQHLAIHAKLTDLGWLENE